MEPDTHVIVVDLGYGDAGKGTIVDWLCGGGGFHTVVRFNGGAQAAHNVVTADGRHHTFAQFGAGSFTPGVTTHLSAQMMVDPLALAAEADHLAEVGVGDAMDRLTIDGRALLTTPWHREANRARERSRGGARHGTCGMGIGETARYGMVFPDEAPTVDDCRSPARLARKLRALSRRLAAELDLSPMPPVEDVVAVFTAFAEAVTIVDGGHLGRLLDRGPVVFEGAQGVLLDEWFGFHPYTTWSTTTTANAETILDEVGHSGRAVRLGVLRTYATRHGPGPLVTQDAALTARLKEPHNATGPWQGGFRCGHFDTVAARYALSATGGVDSIALTHVDAALGLSICGDYRLPSGSSWAPTVSGDRDLVRQQQLTTTLATVKPVLAEGPRRSSDWPGAVEQALGVPVSVTSHGPTSADKVRHAPLAVAAV